MTFASNDLYTKWSAPEEIQHFRSHLLSGAKERLETRPPFYIDPLGATSVTVDGISVLIELRTVTFPRAVRQSWPWKLIWVLEGNNNRLSFTTEERYVEKSRWLWYSSKSLIHYKKTDLILEDNDLVVFDNQNLSEIWIHSRPIFCVVIPLHYRYSMLEANKLMMKTVGEEK